MVIVPVLLEPILAATEKATVPLPVPLPPAVTVIHEALLTAVQVQPTPAETLTLPFPPVSPKLAFVADSE